MVVFEEMEEALDDVPPSMERLLDAEEIEKAAASVTRPTAKMHLEALSKKLRKESEALKRVEDSRTKEEEDKMEVEEKTTPTPAAAPIPKRTPATSAPVVSKSVQYVPIDKFAFDAGGYNAPFVTLYIDLPGVGSTVDKENITCQFTPTSFDLIVRGYKGKNYRLWKEGELEHDIDVSRCKKIVKADKIVIKLAKIKNDYGSFEHWTSLTDKKKLNKSKNNSKEKDDPANSIMNLMKEMYDTGDDNMKKIIGETMMKQRAGKLGGKDGMPDMSSAMGGLTGGSGMGDYDDMDDL